MRDLNAPRCVRSASSSRTRSDERAYVASYPYRTSARRTTVSQYNNECGAARKGALVDVAFWLCSLMSHLARPLNYMLGMKCPKCKSTFIVQIHTFAYVIFGCGHMHVCCSVGVRLGVYTIIFAFDGRDVLVVAAGNGNVLKFSTLMCPIVEYEVVCVAERDDY